MSPDKWRHAINQSYCGKGTAQYMLCIYGKLKIAEVCTYSRTTTAYSILDAYPYLVINYVLNFVTLKAKLYKTRFHQTVDKCTQHKFTEIGR